MVEIINQTKQSLNLDDIKTYCEVLNKKNNINFEIIFVNSNFIRSLNKLYRKIDHPTDILTFENSDIGQIFICPNIAQVNAKKFKNSLKKEIELLILHGYNHLIGKYHG